MKTVGLFTIYICNYGAVLQTYALKKCIEDNYADINVSIVDFYSYEHYQIFQTCAKNVFKRLMKYGMILIHYNSILTRNKREREFIAKEFNLSKRFETVRDLLNRMPSFDYYLTGSDQVFNRSSKYSDIFYQQFEIQSGTKAAYAPSFGQSKFSPAEINEIKELTQGFDYLSCRERDGADMLSQVCGSEVPCVIDPTLLLNKEQWGQMMKTPDIDEKYLLVYDLNGGVPMLDIARKVAMEKGLKIYCITRHADVAFIYKDIDKVIFDAGPREFVGYFSKASYVITDSFHGTAFSLIFQKDFNTYIAVQQSSQRIKSLLDVCGLCNRIIDGAKVLDTSDDCMRCLDRSAFEKYRQSSLDYLTKIFN